MKHLTRSVLLPGALLGLMGCGFHPVYAPAASGEAGPAANDLAAIDVALVPERSGQILRQDVQARLERFGIAAAKRYRLSIAYTVAEEPIGTQPDSSATYMRVRAAANWSLNRTDPKTTLVTTGVARAMDGFNIIDLQIFTSELEAETVTKKLSETIADQIALQLGIYFKQHPELDAAT